MVLGALIPGKHKQRTDAAAVSSSGAGGGGGRGGDDPASSPSIEDWGERDQRVVVRSTPGSGLLADLLLRAKVCVLLVGRWIKTGMVGRREHEERSKRGME